MRRRQFLKIAGAGAAGSLFLPDWAEAADRRGMKFGWSSSTPTTPIPESIPFPWTGVPSRASAGPPRRATLIERVRAEHPNVLLLDSGDIFQGTPYFNFFKGEIEFKAMSAMGYDVATIGNHDFDNGVEGLVEMMPHANFQFVSANYDVSGSPLEPFVEPWVIKEVRGSEGGDLRSGHRLRGVGSGQPP